MSNFLSIATVSALLQRNLQEALHGDDHVGDVVTLRPEDIHGKNQPRTLANIYLYQITPNAAWRNHDLSSRNFSGDLTMLPRAALDLHYLISCYGVDADLQPQAVMGSIVRYMHENPVLTHKRIENVMGSLPATLRDCDLGEEVELVKFTPIGLSLEELAKLWSVFLQTPYRLSVAYQASVVFVEKARPLRRIRLVQEPKIYVQPTRRPAIEKIGSEKEDEPILPGSKLVLHGQDLKGEGTMIRLNRNDKLLLKPTQVSGIRITLPVPEESRAGPNVLQVLYGIKPGTERPRCESNVAEFLVSPLIKPSVSNVIDGKKPGERSAMIQVGEISPKIEKKQKVQLLLNQLEVPSETVPEDYTFPAPVNNGIPTGKEETDKIAFEIDGVKPGKYLVCLSVDGAESPQFIEGQTKGKNLAEVKIT